MLLSFDSAVERISSCFRTLFKSIRFHNPVTNETPPRMAEANAEGIVIRGFATDDNVTIEDPPARLPVVTDMALTTLYIFFYFFKALLHLSISSLS